MSYSSKFSHAACFYHLFGRLRNFRSPLLSSHKDMIRYCRERRCVTGGISDGSRRIRRNRHRFYVRWDCHRQRCYQSIKKYTWASILQWLTYLLHFNELSLRAPFIQIDESTEFSNSFTCLLVKQLKKCETLPIPKFEPIDCILPDVDADDLSSDKKYVFQVFQAKSATCRSNCVAVNQELKIMLVCSHVSKNMGFYGHMWRPLNQLDKSLHC